MNPIDEHDRLTSNRKGLRRGVLTALMSVLMSVALVCAALVATSTATATATESAAEPTAVPAAVTGDRAAPAAPSVGAERQVNPRGGKGKPKGPKARPWSGYRIKKNGTAAGGWIGGYKQDGQIVYRIDPGAKPKNSTYAPAQPVSEAGGKATPASTTQAAYILSKYGSFNYDVQAAAVDVAMGHLLGGKSTR